MEFVEQLKSIWISCLALCSDLNACYGRISELQWLRMWMECTGGEYTKYDRWSFIFEKIFHFHERIISGNKLYCYWKLNGAGATTCVYMNSLWRDATVFCEDCRWSSPGVMRGWCIANESLFVVRWTIEWWTTRLYWRFHCSMNALNLTFESGTTQARAHTPGAAC